jgi:hypothetical protein
MLIALIPSPKGKGFSCSEKIKIAPQPTDCSCGPTTLQAMYTHLGLEISIEQLIAEVECVDNGGTLAVLLGIDAIKRGFRVKLYSYDINFFDPTWKGLPSKDLIDKLVEQEHHKNDPKFLQASAAFARFLSEGGEILFDEMTPELLRELFLSDKPVLTGLSATWLNKCKREYTGSQGESVYDDVQGGPLGHFVILYGIDENLQVSVADPDLNNDIVGENLYKIPFSLILQSVMLGIVTYDANFLVISRD